MTAKIQFRTTKKLECAMRMTKSVKKPVTAVFSEGIRNARERR